MDGGKRSPGSAVNVFLGLEEVRTQSPHPFLYTFSKVVSKVGLNVRENTFLDLWHMNSETSVLPQARVMTI